MELSRNRVRNAARNLRASAGRTLARVRRRREPSEPQAPGVQYGGRHVDETLFDPKLTEYWRRFESPVDPTHVVQPPVREARGAMYGEVLEETMHDARASHQRAGARDGGLGAKGSARGEEWALSCGCTVIANAFGYRLVSSVGCTLCNGTPADGAHQVHRSTRQRTLPFDHRSVFAGLGGPPGHGNY